MSLFSVYQYASQLIKKLLNIKHDPELPLRLELQRSGFKKTDYELEGNGFIYLKELDIHISIEKHKFIINAIRDIRGLMKVGNVELSLTEQDEAIICLDGLELIVTTAEEFFILEEIFVQGCYNFELEEPVIVWDVGMNVAYGSLFFGLKENVVKIYGYEPFQETYKQAIRNINRNDAILHKINPNNFGLSGTTRNLITEYSKEWKGHAGINLLEDYIQKNSVIQHETIVLEKADGILDNIANANPNINILLKMDCEGSEYEIIDVIYNSPNFSKIKIIMLEWHYKGPELIVSKLLPLGFKCISLQPKNKNVGIIYAFR